MKTPLIAALAGTLLLAACQKPPPPASVSDAAGNTVTEWPLPAPIGAAQPDLSLAPDGRLLLSWIRPLDRGRHALQYTSFDRKGQWQWAPKTIAVGASMVASWADTPHIAATADGALWTHWLQKTRGVGESRDIVAARSGDDGVDWGDPVRVHDDGKAVEHGFVSFWPAARDRIGIAWLDGRNTLGEAMPAEHAARQHGADAHAMHAGRMSLRGASMDAATRIRDAVEIDASVCDCCQTDVAVTARGPLLVYRGRSVDEIRDIRATRLDNGAWRAPRIVHADNWRMPGCPVNGPAVAADGNRAVVAWYSAANDKPLLQLAYSQDAGDRFAAPVVVDSGDASQGRSDVAIDARQVWVAWLREDAGGQSLWLARYAPDLSRRLARIEVAKLQGRGRGTGFPKLALRDGKAYLVWTDIAAGVPRLRGVRVSAR